MTQWRKTTLSALAFSLLALIVYWPSLGGEFIVDDNLWAATPAPEFAQVLHQAISSWGFNESVTGVAGPPIFRPVANFLIGLEHWAFDQNPAPYRLTSLALHVVNATLIFILLTRLFPAASSIARVSAAAIFLVHPALVEAVAWISSAAELFMTTFVLGAVILFLRSRDMGERGDFIAFLMLSIAAIFSKEAALALPLILLLIQYFRGQALLTREFFAASIIVVIYLVWRHLVVSTSAIDGVQFSPLRAAEFGLAHLSYLLIPSAQPFSIAPVSADVSTDLRLVLTATLLMGATVFVWYRRKDALPLFLFGLAWMFLALWPAYAIALVGDGYFAGRHAYLPAAGLSIMVAALVSRFAHTSLFRYSAAIGIAALGVLSALASVQWSSNLHAYTRAGKLSPHASGPWVGLGEYYLERQNFAEAARVLEVATQKIHLPAHEPEIRFMLAHALAQLGRLNESSAQLQRVVEIAPTHSFAWNGLGNNAWASGNPALAEHYYLQAIRTNPGNQQARSNLISLRQQRSN